MGCVVLASALSDRYIVLVKTYRINHYDGHGCRIEYLYTDRAHPRYYTRSQITRDIPAEVAAHHPGHIIDRAT
jgi:hypothetical protein